MMFQLVVQLEACVLLSSSSKVGDCSYLHPALQRCCTRPVVERFGLVFVPATMAQKMKMLPSGKK